MAPLLPIVQTLPKRWPHDADDAWLSWRCGSAALKPQSLYARGRGLVKGFLLDVRSEAGWVKHLRSHLWLAWESEEFIQLPGTQNGDVRTTRSLVRFLFRFGKGGYPTLDPSRNLLKKTPSSPKIATT